MVTVGYIKTLPVELQVSILGFSGWDLTRGPK